ncbi:MAG: ABC transporter substrate-binding protein [Lachnospiraceae bacterium]|nr:ABC transporter substrate-binding protein [Lachnospiraceae bacterium]
MKRALTIILTLCLAACLFAGCGGSSTSGTADAGGAAQDAEALGGDTQAANEEAGVSESSGSDAQAANAEAGTPKTSADAQADSGVKKTMVIGDTTFNPENAEPDVNPHNDYAGWATIRYGVGETLFKLSDEMELTPWLATEWENVDDTTWKITLRDGVKFSSGRDMDAEAVKQCLTHLIENHDRAPGDLALAEIEADGQILTLKTSEPRPALLNYLCDPYGCIIDVEAGFDGGIVAGTGPYIAVDCESGDHLNLIKNENYWGGMPHIDELTIRTISDGNTLSAALQAGDIDAAYGMAYEAYPLFQNDNYKFSQVATSRAFFCWMNFESPLATDPAVRKAIAMGIDKEGFVTTLLEGNGEVAKGAFPESFSFAGNVQTESYDPEAAAAVLEEAGWVDSDGDGIREKDGKKLEIKWLTYPSRQELPLLAESAQATLKDIGIAVDVNCTADHNSIIEDMGAWDVYASANVNASIGDPEYFFTSFCLDSSTKNKGRYHSDEMEELEKQMAVSFDAAKRAELSEKMQQVILDDNAWVFCSFLKMSMISKASVTGYDCHPTDFYQVTADLDIG